MTRQSARASAEVRPMSPQRSLAVVPTLVLAAVLVLLGSAYALRVSAAATFSEDVRLRATRQAADTALEQMLDEETGVRGYLVARDRSLLAPYTAASKELPATLQSLGSSLTAAQLAPGDAGAATALLARWTREVAVPALRGGGDSRADQAHGKALVDAFRERIARIRGALDGREASIDAARRADLDRISVFASVAVAALGLFALLFLRRERAMRARLEVARARSEAARLRSSELRAAYVAEKRIADSLQDAIAQRPLPLHPSLRFSATYVPATDESRVGGDWYDAIELPQNRVLFAIGDVTGHGLDAAVTMSRARQSLITSALFDADPAVVLARVNDDLLGQHAPMVTAVAGFADAKSYEFVYASAGHPPPVLLEPNRPPRLLDFGGVPLGVVGGATYDLHRIQSVPGAMLVLYTDGAIEHTRDVIEGETLLLASVAEAARSGVAEAASVIHDRIFHGNVAGDDVAILTIGFGGDDVRELRISADDAQTSTASRISRDDVTALVRNLAGLRRAS